MKKLFLFVVLSSLFGLLNAQTNYYVATNGDDTSNDGLTEATAFATVGVALSAVQAEFAADNINNIDFVINIGEGSFVAHTLKFAEGSANLSVVFKGSGADKTIIKGVDKDVSEGYSGKKLIDNVTGGAVNKGLTITLEDATFYNYSNSYTGGIINMNSSHANGLVFNANRCVFSGIKVNTGAIMASSHATNAFFRQCSFIDIISTSKALFHITRGNLTIEDCYFDNCVRTYDSGTGNANGIILHTQPTVDWVTGNNTIINNTFVNCGVTDVTGLTAEKNLFSINIQQEGIKTTFSKQNLTFANNIICGSINIDNDISALNISDKASDFVYTNCTNNIFSSLKAAASDALSSFPTSGNQIIADLSFTSTEVNFIMDGTALDTETADNGLIYATATGTEVVDKALLSVQTSTDIIGTTRNTNGGCIGAVEYIAPGEQVITFDAIDAVKFSQAADITLEQNSSAGLIITYQSSNTAVATIAADGYTVQAVGVGTATITATQAGDATYEAAIPVSQDVYFAPDTLTYYLSATGDDDNDGLSTADAKSTFSGLLTEIQAQYDNYNAIDTCFVINIGEGTFYAGSDPMFTFTHNAAPVTFIYQGTGAGTSTLSGGETSPSNKRLISAGTSYENLTIKFEDLTLTNFTKSGGNAGGLLNSPQVTPVNMNFSFNRCNITSISSRQGAVIFIKSGGSLSMTNSYIGDNSIVESNNWSGALIEIQQGDVTLENNVFYNNTYERVACVRNIGLIVHIPCTNSNMNINITNNSLVNNKFTGVDDTSILSTICLQVGSEKTADVTLANNLLVNNTCESTNTFTDIDIIEAGTLTFTNSSNNIFGSVSDDFTETGNDVNAYTYSDEAIDFTMDGESPALLSTSKGVYYVQANGTAVSEMALASVAPSTDITGEERAISPSIGAAEAFNPGTPTAISNTSITSLYPNPIVNTLFISENVSAIAMYSLDGRIVCNTTVSNNQVDVSQIPSGLYIVKCADTNGNTIDTQRIVKQ